MSRGVTTTEFAAMCQQHMPKWPGGRFPIESARPFLERCCDLGLLRREDMEGTVHYFPTARLSRVVGEWGPPDA